MFILHKDSFRRINVKNLQAVIGLAGYPQCAEQPGNVPISFSVCCSMIRDVVPEDFGGIIFTILLSQMLYRPLKFFSALYL